MINVYREIYSSHKAIMQALAELIKISELEV